MRIKGLIWCGMCALVAAPAACSADAVVIDFREDASVYNQLDGKATGMATHGLVVFTVTASEGVLNRTGSGFGVNDPGDDDTDALNLGQYVEIQFNEAVTLLSVSVSSWGSGSAAEALVGADGLFEHKGWITSSGDTPFDFTVRKGESLRLEATGETTPTNGFSLDGLAVATIPEPLSLGLVGCTGLAVLALRRLPSR